MPVGYSGTPLLQKLGIKPGHRVCLLSAPEGFSRTLGALPPEVTLSPIVLSFDSEDESGDL